MLIPRDKKDKEIAQDLFPSNFIVHLQTPSNYLGPKHIFGLEELKEVRQEAFDGLPVVNNELDFDYYDFIPDGHKKDYLVPDTLPASLKKAIKCFKKAIEINNKFSMAHYNLGKAFRELYNYKEAIKWQG